MQLMIIWLIFFVTSFKAIQIVPERDHWIATASLSTGEVCVYVSSFTGRLNASTEVQLARIYNSLVENGTLMVTVVSVQQQPCLWTICHHLCPQCSLKRFLQQAILSPRGHETIIQGSASRNRNCSHSFHHRKGNKFRGTK